MCWTSSSANITAKLFLLAGLWNGSGMQGIQWTFVLLSNLSVASFSLWHESCRDLLQYPVLRQGILATCPPAHQRCTSPDLTSSGTFSDLQRFPGGHLWGSDFPWILWRHRRHIPTHFYLFGHANTFAYTSVKLRRHFSNRTT
jgi:hypothetical protein